VLCCSCHHAGLNKNMNYAVRVAFRYERLKTSECTSISGVRIRIYSERDSGTAIPSVRPSLCLSHSGIVSKRLNVSSKFFHRLITYHFSLRYDMKEEFNVDSKAE